MGKTVQKCGYRTVRHVHIYRDFRELYLDILQYKLSPLFLLNFIIFVMYSILCDVNITIFSSMNVVR